jgi:hypothetical protein
VTSCVGVSRGVSYLEGRGNEGAGEEGRGKERRRRAGREEGGRKEKRTHHPPLRLSNHHLRPPRKLQRTQRLSRLSLIRTNRTNHRDPAVPTQRGLEETSEFRVAVGDVGG